MPGIGRGWYGSVQIVVPLDLLGIAAVECPEVFHEPRHVVPASLRHGASAAADLLNGSVSFRHGASSSPSTAVPVTRSYRWLYPSHHSRVHWRMATITGVVRSSW